VRFARFIYAMFALAVLFGLPDAAYAHAGHERSVASSETASAHIRLATTFDQTCETDAARSCKPPAGTAILTIELPPSPTSGDCIGSCCCQGVTSCGGGHSSAQQASSGITFDTASSKTNRPPLSKTILISAPIYGLDRPPKYLI
jgi:hypothetical protein